MIQKNASYVGLQQTELSLLPGVSTSCFGSWTLFALVVIIKILVKGVDVLGPLGLEQLDVHLHACVLPCLRYGTEGPPG